MRTAVVTPPCLLGEPSMKRTFVLARGLFRAAGLVTLASLAAAQSTAGWTWTGVEILEPVMLSSSPPEAPFVACDAAGHAVSVWNSPAKGIVFAERCPSGTWSAANPIVPGAVGAWPHVAIGSSGVVAATWAIPAQQYVPPKLAVTVRQLAGSFPGPVIWTTASNVSDPRVGVALDGSVTLIWGEGGRIKSATMTPAGLWSAPAFLSPSGVTAWLPELAVNEAGAAIAAWQEAPIGGSGPGVISAACRVAPSSSPWGAAQAVSSGTGQQTWNPKPGIDAAGNVALGYIDGNAMMLARKPNLGNWSAPVRVSLANDTVYYPALAMDAAGNVLAAWQKLDASNYGRISKRLVPATGPWGTVTQLSNGTQDASWPRASIARDGSVWAVTWGDNNTFATEVAIGDASGASTVHSIGSVWWNTEVPVAAGAGAVSAVWPAPTNNPNVTRMVANVFTGSNHSYCTAGTTSHGCVPSILGSGHPSASAGSGFTITVQNVEGQQNGLIFYGLQGGQATPWSSASTSLLCVKPPTQRMTVQASGGTLGSCDGMLSTDWNAFVATHPGALGTPFSGAELVWAQGWFRDAASAKTTSLSDGLMFVVCP